MSNSGSNYSANTGNYGVYGASTTPNSYNTNVNSNLSNKAFDLNPNALLTKATHQTFPALSVTADTTLQRLWQDWFNQYVGQQTYGISNGGYTPTSFSNFLQNAINPMYQLARFSPYARNEGGKNYVSPTRWVGF